ncbi:MAG TPA: hypothetical protein VEK07_11765 [Polyangiaceae bacterium]|nr:hypothetical protein [Polyangiaceae bacterium]
MSKERREEEKPSALTAEAVVPADVPSKRDATIRIAVRLAGVGTPGEGASAGSAFWSRLYPARSKDSPNEDSAEDRTTAHENALTRNFGEGLRNALLRNQDFHDGESRKAPHGESPDGGITFWLRLDHVDYESQSFGLVVTGASKFLRFFDEDTHLCEAVLASLVPESLVWASSLGKHNSNEEAMDRIASVEVDASSLEPFMERPVQAPSRAPERIGAPLSLPQPPQASPSPPQSKVEAPSAGKELPAIAPDRSSPRRAPLGGALLVPVLLALAVLYAAFAFVRDERSSLRDERDALAKRADEALSRERSALKDERAAIDARLEREVDREVERASFWAQLGEDLSKQPAARPVERRLNPPVINATTTTAAADTKPAAAAPHP